MVPTKSGSRSIKSRPTSPYSFTATLKLFASDTENSAIDDGTATALATQDFTFILEAAEVEYKMQVAVQDKDKNPITDASITVEKDGWDKVTPASDGSYKMENGASYKLTVKKEGYTDYSETFTYTDGPANTVDDLGLRSRSVKDVGKHVRRKRQDACCHSRASASNDDSEDCRYSGNASDCSYGMAGDARLASRAIKVALSGRRIA